jgi:ankyrin repeat protein
LAFGVAALNGHFECFKDIEYLLDSKIARKEYFETCDNFGRHFLHLAALSGCVDCLEYFLQNDCDPNSVDKSGKYAFCFPIFIILSLKQII